MSKTTDKEDVVTFPLFIFLLSMVLLYFFQQQLRGEHLKLVLVFECGGNQNGQGEPKQQPNWFPGEPIWLLFWFWGVLNRGGGGANSA